jgi:hypothetical protein
MKQIGDMSKMLVEINEEGMEEEDDFSSCCSVEEEKFQCF